MNDINYQIDQAHAAAEAVKDQVHQIEAKTAAIPGAARMIPLSQYGKDTDRQAVARNLTLRSMIERQDPALAAFLGFGSDVPRREAEDTAQRQALIERMAQLSVQTRQQNQAAQLGRERCNIAGITPLTRQRRL